MTTPAVKNLEVGVCACPICHAAGASVRLGASGKHYINCDVCVTLIRSMSRAGDDAILAMMSAARAPASSSSAVNNSSSGAPPAETPKKRGSFADALSALGGRSS